MKPGGEDDVSALPQAELSAGDPTLSEPAVAARRARDVAPPSFSTQIRDRQRYKFLAEHGRGGIGRVSRAHDRELGRDIAIKELLSRGSAHEARFLREVLLTARLEHPGIVPVHEAGRWPDGTPFYAMKLVSGRPLRELLAERRTVEARLGLLHHVIAVADAIAYAHGRQIIHRDLKPSNIIVGEFGETVVIDWGLAKDLTITDEPTGGGSDGQLRATGTPGHSDHDLTMAGAVLGTPAYMSPEQKYGEQVDQRTDVYAIGIMLWELCAIQKIPPDDPAQRHGLLRDAGIDDDFATIINKALDPDPELRYPDAGALAADLKAFKSGARIAARSYSLFAMLAHWTRHHRTLALSSGAALVVALIGSLVFVRNIAVERDRADASETAARRAQSSTETALDELTLNHAQLLLTTDPSAAVDALVTYQGTDRSRADQVRAEAHARGVAVVRALPHTEGVFWTEAAPDGAILSLSTDGTIARTALDGKTSVLIRGVSKIAIPAYSAARHLLAYTCDPSDVCLFDVVRAARLPLAPVLRNVHVNGIAFSPDGSLFAVLAQDGVLRIFEVTDPAHPALRLTRPITDGASVTFLDDTTAAVATTAGVSFVDLAGDVRAFPAPGFSYWAGHASEHAFAFATEAGQALLFAGNPLHVTATATLCRGALDSVQFIAGRHDLAYACRAGDVGLWDPQRNVATSRAQLEGHADLLVTSPAGDYLVAGGGNGTVTVIDLQTDLIASYKGHGFRVTAIAPPTPEHPFLISGDVRGAVRAWPLPPRVARVVATSSSPFLSAMFDHQATIATTWQPALTIVSPSAGVREVGPHEAFNTSLERSDTGDVFASYGLTDLVEVWDPATMTRTRVFATGHGSVSQLAFVRGSDDFITSGHDGRLLRWTPAGASTLLAQVDQPIDKFAALPDASAIVFSTADGALWRTDAGGHAIALKPAGARVSQIVAAAAHRTIYAGWTTGDVVAIDTASWQLQPLLHAGGAIQAIASSDDAQTMAVASNDGVVHISGAGRIAVAGAGSTTWDSLAARAAHVVLTADGLLIAACTDGTIWVYAIARRRWLCLPTGTVDLGRIAITADGKSVVAVDREGRLIGIDLDAARKLIDAQPGSPTTGSPTDPTEKEHAP